METGVVLAAVLRCIFLRTFDVTSQEPPAKWAEGNKTNPEFPQRGDDLAFEIALQSEYSLWERNLESEIIPTLRELGIGLVPFCPLGRGLLAGNVRRAEECTAKDHRQYDPRFHGENFDANRNAVGIVRNIAEAIGAKPSQVALAWLLGKGDFIVPIPGTKRRVYLEENAGAVDIKLGDDDIARLEAALRPESVSGPRYNEKAMAWVDR